MPIDFSDLLDGDDTAVVHPRDIFFTLNRDPAFSFPRDIQTEVMNLWFDRRTEKDTILKLNVGSGKTLVGLLLLQSCLNEGIAPALYVAPDNQLVDQVMAEAAALGIAVTDDPKDPGFQAGEKIAVVNIYKLFNGRSVFGVGSEGSKIRIGSVVIDDAHACVATVTKQFRVTLPNTHEAYRLILSTLSDDLKRQSEARYLEVKDSDPRAVMEVPFWSWQMHQSDILSALHKHRTNGELIFSYPFISEILTQCRCLIGGQKLEIEPPFPATDLIQSFRTAKRRIHMTATLSDDSVIATHFGANPEALSAPLVPASSQSIGERMILLPQELNPNLNIPKLKGMLAKIGEDHNVVVIVPSSAVASEWADKADQVLLGDEVAPGVAKLRQGHVGLTVLVNRYDGIDLPGDACRVLALVDLPEASSYAQVADEVVLNDSIHSLRRQIQRIEQGMGRGIRSNDDYCAVLLVGAKLTQRIRSKDGEDLLTPATRAQMQLSRKLAKKLDTPTAKEIRNTIYQCLDRDQNWIKVSKNALVGLEADNELRLDPARLAIRKAFDFARSGQHQDAVECFNDAISDASDDQEKAWLLSKQAAFQHALDPQAAQNMLLAAHNLERSVLKPLQGVIYKKLSSTSDQQTATIIERHGARFLEPTDLILYADALCSDLRFNDVTAEKFEAAVNELAWFLGLNGQRPEKEYGEGPDNLWALPSGGFLVIESKNEVTSEGGISKKDAGQLGQSMAWFKTRYLGSKATPVMIHPMRKLGPAASAVPDMRIIDEQRLEKLRTSVKALAQSLTNPDTTSSKSAVAARLTEHGLNSDALIDRITTTPKA